MSRRGERDEERGGAERNRLLAEVEEEFSSRVVHQVKTPLAIMHGYARTLLEQELPDEDRRWFLRVIAEQSKRISVMIDTLEELQRVHHASPRRAADLGETLRLATARVHAVFPDRRVEFKPGSGSGVVVRGEERWLARAFEEAIASLLVEGDGPAGVEIRVRRGPSVSVSIQGPVEPAGKGLGLYLARRVAEQFEGRLVRRGSRLTFHLRPMEDRGR